MRKLKNEHAGELRESSSKVVKLTLRVPKKRMTILDCQIQTQPHQPASVTRTPSVLEKLELLNQSSLRQNVLLARALKKTQPLTKSKPSRNGKNTQTR